MQKVSQLMKSFAANESGATAIEYGLIVSLIFLAIVSAVSAFSEATIAMYEYIASAMT